MIVVITPGCSVIMLNYLSHTLADCGGVPLPHQGSPGVLFPVRSLERCLQHRLQKSSGKAFTTSLYRVLQHQKKCVEGVERFFISLNLL